MSKAKTKVLAIVAALTLALIMGATMDGPEFGTSDDQASGSTPAEMMKVAGEPEDSHGGG